MEISEVRKFITNPGGDKYEIKKVKKWVLNLKNDNNEVIATRKQHFNTEAEAKKARDEIISFAKKIFTAEKILIVEHLLLRPRNKPGIEVPLGDTLLPICIKDCELCGEEDPYSFRLTVVLDS